MLVTVLAVYLIPNEDTSSVSRMIDQKTEEQQSEEEKFDIAMRKEGTWYIESWREERTGVGPNQLRVKKKQEPHDGRAELYADDSTARASGKTWDDVKANITRTIKPVFQNMKAARLKVNEDKTKLLIIASNQKRRAEGGLSVSMVIGGKEIKPESSARSLGVLISSDLSWREQTQAKLKDCGSQLAALRNVQTLVTKRRRKELAQSIVMSRLEYALEVTSTGRAKDMQDLQYLKVKLARWVLGARRLGWSTTKGFQKLHWMTIQQTAAYKSIRMGIKVLQNGHPETLYEKLTVPVRIKKQGLPLGMEHEERELRVISTEELQHMCAGRRKSWSVRTIRWFHKVPLAVLGKFYETPGSKTALKKWVKENIPTTGDNILHGKFNKEGGQEGGDAEPGEDREPPNRRGRRKAQGEEDIGRQAIQKAKQQKFMIDWMRPGENVKGSHTCVLGSSVRTGGRVVMANRKVEGLIIRKVWVGESQCSGCKATEKEISEESSWLEETVKPDINNEASEQSRKSRHVEIKKKSNAFRLLIFLLTVKSFTVALMIKHEVKASEKKTVKRNKEHWELHRHQHVEGQKSHEGMKKMGIG